MKIIKPYHRILDPIDGEAILQKIELCGRTCYKSEDRITEDSAKKFVAGIIKSGHHSVIEHVNITVKFITDRGVLAELTRHRLASYSVESTRYCNYSEDKFDNQITVILPTGFDKRLIGEDFCLSDDGYFDIDFSNIERSWFESCQDSENGYVAMLKYGAKPEIARSVLPTSLKTEIVMTCNLREWKHIFRMRCQKAAHPQIREIMLPLLEELHEKIPVVFDEEYEMFIKKTSCSHCAHWNDGYGNDDICGCLGCAQNCDNYLEFGGEPCPQEQQ